MSTQLPPYESVELRMHYHDNDGLSDQLEVTSAPTQTAISIDLLAKLERHRCAIYNGDTLIFGTPELGRGRVAYLIYAWDSDAKAVRAVLLPKVPEQWLADEGIES